MATPTGSRSKPAPNPRAQRDRAYAPDLEAVHLSGGTARVYIGDCTRNIPRIPECARGEIDLVFADPPFNWNRDYDRWKQEHPGGSRAEYDTWHDAMPREDFLNFTRRWLDACRASLRPGGAMWVNIPDDTAAEIVVHLKQPSSAGGRELPAMQMVNWCVWHYRFGQNTTSKFINSKVHALYFVDPRGQRTWNPEAVLELSDRRAVYFDPRTEEKNDGMPAGMRVPMDVWYGKYWGRIQGNNKERRPGHDNQLPEVYLRRVVRACSNPGDLVMDPFLGSGTTGVIAFHENRRFIGCEYSAANAASAWERITRIGPLPRGQEEGEPQSTAIHAPRKRGRKATGTPGQGG
jgi:site-specific DNA-methyltransferase (adenine-specific)